MIVFQKQAVMRRVLYALAPLFLFALYLYSWKVFVIAGLVFSSGILSEYLIEKYNDTKKTPVKVTEAVLVTCSLYTLSMPPSLAYPQNWWIVILGIVFAVLIGKGVYGGFGRNVFNPAIVGRLFVYLSFPALLGSGWSLGGNFGLIDEMTGATALFHIKLGQYNNIQGGLDLILGTQTPPWLNLFLGTRAGTLGESSILLLILSALYLIYTKTASYRLILGTLISAYVSMAILHYGFQLSNVAEPHWGLLGGSLVFVSVFMVTDPISSPNKPLAQWIYAVLVGLLIVLIRSFSAFPEGTSFAIIIANSFAALLDEVVTPLSQSKKSTPKEVS